MPWYKLCNHSSCVLPFTTPIILLSGCNKPQRIIFTRAGISLRLVKSPPAPKITILVGSVGSPMQLMVLDESSILSPHFSVGRILCPPKPARIAFKIFPAKEGSCLLRKRICKASVNTGVGTAKSIDSCTVQRPSPESST